MSFAFKPAEKTQAKLRLALVAPAGGGKTWTALTVAQGLGDRVAVIDTEHGSASKYADSFSFDVLELDSFDPRNYIEAISVASGFDVLIIDSLSHAWSGKDGALEMVDKAAAANQGNSFVGWRNVTPLHNQLVEAMLSFPGHLIVTMRAKTAYAMEEYEDRAGRKKTKPVKIGLAPIQREGVDFEFDIVADLNTENTLVVSKTRCSALTGAVFNKPGENFIAPIREWLSSGRPAPAPEVPLRAAGDPSAGPEKAAGDPPPPAQAAPAASPPSDELPEWRRTWWSAAQSAGFSADDVKVWMKVKHRKDSTAAMTAAEFEGDIEVFVKDPDAVRAVVNLSKGGLNPSPAGRPQNPLSDEDAKRYRRQLYALGRELGMKAEEIKADLKGAGVIQSSTKELSEEGWRAAIASYKARVEPPTPTEG